MITNFNKDSGLSLTPLFSSRHYDLDENVIGVFVDQFNELGLGADAFSEKVKLSDDIFKQYLKTIDSRNASLSGFQDWLKQSGYNLDNVTLKTRLATAGMRAFSLAINSLVNMAAVFVVSKAFEVAVKAVDDYIHRLDNAKQAFQDSTSELDSINKELEENERRITELNALPKLTYAQEGELENLRNITKELNLQKDIQEREVASAAENLSNENRSAFEREYGKDYSFDLENAKSLASQYADSVTSIYDLSEQGIEGIAAAWIKLQNIQEKAKQSGDTGWLEDQVTMENYLSDLLVSEVSKLQGYKDTLDELKGTEYFSEDDQAFYDAINDAMELAYRFMDSGTWNSIQVEDIFNTDGIERTKEELIDLYKAGELDETTLSGFRNLSSAINDSNLILEDGQSNIQAFIEEISALASQEEDVAAQVEETSSALSKQGQIAAINSLSEGFESLDKIMASIKDKDNPFDYALLDDDNFKENFSSLGESYENFIETVSDSPKDLSACQDAFNNLVTEWLQSTGVLDSVTDETAELTKNMLQNMGISNADIVVTKALAANKKIATLTTQELTDAAVNEIIQLVNEGQQLDYVQQKVLAYALEKANANSNVLSTAADIQNIMALVTACGSGVTALKALYAARNGVFLATGSPENAPAGMSQDELKAITSFNATGSLPTNPQDAKLLQSAKAKADKYNNDLTSRAQEEIQAALDKVNNLAQVEYNGGTSTNKGSGSGKKDKTETSQQFDWLEQKIEDVRKAYEALNEEASDTDNTFANQLNYLNAAISKEQELIEYEKLAAEAYKAQWEEASAGLSDDIRNKIMGGDFNVEEGLEEYTGDQATAIQEANSAWESYKNILDQISDDEETLGDNQETRYQKQIEWSRDEIENLREKGDIEQTSYEDQLDYLEQAEAKSEELTDKLQERADEANQKWEEAKATINSIDIARIMRGELNLMDPSYTEEYRQLLIDAQSAYEDNEDAQEELEEQEKTNAELAKEVYEKATEYYEAQQDALDNLNSTSQSAIDLIEALGGEATADIYRDMIANSKELVDLYQQQQDEAEDYLSELDEGSPEYYEVLSQIEACNQKILECRKNQAEWNEAIQDLPIRKLERFQAILQNIKQDLQNWIDERSVLGENPTQSQLQGLIDLSNKQIESNLESIKLLQEKLSGYEWNSDKYNETAQEIQDLEDDISSLIQSQAEWNEEIKQIPINNIEKFQTGIENARQDIENWINEQKALGRPIDIEQYQALFDLSNKQIDTLREKIALLNRNLATYEVGSDKYNETAAAIQEAENEISSIVQEQAEWNDQILNLPIEKIDKYVNQLQGVLDALQNVQDDYDTVISAVTEAIDRQSEAVQENRDAEEEAWNAKIDQIQETIDALQDAKDEEDLLLKVEKARAAFAKAQEQKTNKVLHGGEWTWQADLDEINSTREDLDDALFDKQIDDLEKQKEALEEARDEALKYFDEELDRLEELANKWEQIAEDAEFASNSAIADKYLGAGWEDKVLSGKDEDIYNLFRENYLSNSELIDKYQQQVDAAQQIADLMQQYVDGWKEGSITYAQVSENISKLAEKINTGFGALDNLAGIVDLNGALGNGNDLDSILSGIQNGISSATGDFQKYLQSAQENLDKISESSQTWQEVQSSVLDQLDALQKNYDALGDIDFSAVTENTEAINKLTKTWKEVQADIQKQLEDLEKSFNESQTTANKVYNNIHNSGSGSSGSGGGGSSHDAGNDDGYGPGYEQAIREEYGEDAAKDYHDNYDSGFDESKYEKGPSGSSSSSGTPDNPIVIERKKKHDGLRSGLADKGLNLGTDEDILQALALNRIREDETLALLKKNETVMTPQQVSNVVDNVSSAMAYSNAKIPSKTPLPVVGQTLTQKVDIGGIRVILPNVNDYDGFARAMDKQFPVLLDQIANRIR